MWDFLEWAGLHWPCVWGFSFFFERVAIISAQKCFNLGLPPFLV